MSSCAKRKETTEDDALVGIVTFNPEMGRLKENITAVSKQASSVLIVDNGSENFNEVEKLLEDSKSGDEKAGTVPLIFIIRNEKNEGIATALSQIMDYADEKAYKWVLTLDQDSVIEPGLIDAYIKTANDTQYDDAGMLTCLIHDRNFKDKKYEVQDAPVIEVGYCITSAAFTNVEKYKKTEGYDRKFFIDAVDFDLCYSLRDVGYKIYRINHIGLYHEVGHGENKRFFGKTIVVYHQKPFRNYYMARNNIWVNRKHPKIFGKLRLVKKLLALHTRILLYEDCKTERLKLFWKGIRDA